MAYSDKNIRITPNKNSTSAAPKIDFTDGTVSSSTSISIKIETVNNDAVLSFTGSKGTLFSLVDSFSGVLYSVADGEGVPVLDVLDDGTITFNEYKGRVEILSTVSSISSATGALTITGGLGVRGDVYIGGTIYGTIAGAGVATTATNLSAGTTGSLPYQSSTGTTTFLPIATTSGWILSSNGVTPVWTATSGGTAITLSNDTASTTTHYLAFVSTSTGTVSVLKTAAASGIVYTPSTGNFGIGTVTAPVYKLQVNGSFAATTKSFLIDHPTKQDWKLRYGSLEGPENGIYVRGRLINSNIINLPDYWYNLIDSDTITVNLTSIGNYQQLVVKEITSRFIIIENSNGNGNEINCYYTVFTERIDVEKLVSEIPPTPING